jgi:hypothetical protein
MFKCEQQLTRAVFEHREEALSWKQGGEDMNPQDLKYIVIDSNAKDLRLPDAINVKLEDSWTMVRYYASMIVAREVIESDTLRVVLSFDSHIKIDGIANL